MEKTKEKKLDISREYCHNCGGQLVRDFDKGTEKCTMPGCAIRNVNFTIPFVDEDPGEKEKNNAENKTK